MHGVPVYGKLQRDDLTEIRSKRFEISNVGRKSQWAFFHHIIKNSGKSIGELKLLKPKQVINLIISQKDCAITKEDLEGYDTKPLVNLFRRCLRYEEEVDIYCISKDGDNLAWWCETASDDEIVRLVLSETYKKSWTKNMYARFHGSIKSTTLYRLFEAIKEENFSLISPPTSLTAPISIILSSLGFKPVVSRSMLT